MFGYATDETEELMPLSIVLAHKLNRRLADCRRNNTLDWINPDSKTQVYITASDRVIETQILCTLCAIFNLLPLYAFYGKFYPLGWP